METNPNVKLLLGLSAPHLQVLRTMLRVRWAGTLYVPDQPLMEVLWELEQGMRLAGVPFALSDDPSWVVKPLMGRADPLHPARTLFSILPEEYRQRLKEDAMTDDTKVQLDAHHDELHANVAAAGVDPNAVLAFIKAIADAAPTVVAVVVPLVNTILVIIKRVKGV